MNGTTIQIDTVPPLENLYLKLLSSETETSQHITAGECFAVCVTCARGLPRYIKINIPTYSRRPPLTEKGTPTPILHASDCVSKLLIVLKPFRH